MSTSHEPTSRRPAGSRSTPKGPSTARAARRGRPRRAARGRRRTTGTPGQRHEHGEDPPARHVGAGHQPGQRGARPPRRHRRPTWRARGVPQRVARDGVGDDVRSAHVADRDPRDQVERAARRRRARPAADDHARRPSGRLAPARRPRSSVPVQPAVLDELGRLGQAAAELVEVDARWWGARSSGGSESDRARRRAPAGTRRSPRRRTAATPPTAGSRRAARRPRGCRCRR